MTYDLVADIGGTNMRVAQVVNGQMVARSNFAMTSDRQVAATLKGVAQTLGGVPRGIVAAGAGPVLDRQIRLTNGGWMVSEEEIAAETGASHVRVINDFEAAAWSLVDLEDGDVARIGDSGPLTSGHRVALGPGTGLGAGCLIWDGAQYRVVPGEGGHVAIGPRRADEVDVFLRMAELWPEATVGETFTLEAEALLSGTGLPYLYQACGGEPGIKGPEILKRAGLGEPEAHRCRTIFCDQLAALAGNLAVTLRAAGGIFLVGGVAQANPALFDPVFWEAFRTGGRPEFTDLRAACGIYLVKIEDFGLRGCVNALMQEVSPGT